VPAGLTPTAANNRVINGWTVSVAGQTVTAVRSSVLNPGGAYPVLPVLVAVANNAPPTVNNVVNVSGGAHANPNNNQFTDPTSVTQIPDLTVDKFHTTAFDPGS